VGQGRTPNQIHGLLGEQEAVAHEQGHEQGLSLPLGGALQDCLPDILAQTLLLPGFQADIPLRSLGKGPKIYALFGPKVLGSMQARVGHAADGPDAQLGVKHLAGPGARCRILPSPEQSAVQGQWRMSSPFQNDVFKDYMQAPVQSGLNLSHYSGELGGLAVFFFQ
jgi:hypothetical protein